MSLRILGLAIVIALGQPGCRRTARVDQDWRVHGGDPGHQQYSALDQITRDNVKHLRVAWTYHTRDARENGRSQIQCNPITSRGVLYGSTAQLKVFAVDAASGRELWVFDPFKSGEAQSTLGVNRGLVYWEDGEDRRILVSAGQRLFALDARSGQPILSFGDRGSVSLADGLGRDPKSLFVLSNTPGAVYKDLLILGTRLSEGPGPSPPGHIRAYDVRTGRIRWTFHTIPQPGELGYDTWPADAWTRAGGANAWSGISVDRARGLVFLPTGSAAFDFWGGNRHGANLFANSVLVLKAGTGERVWHYQIVHHDLWDRDLPAAPVLVTVTHGGRRIDAVAQVTKSGHVFLFDRVTGAPLFPIEERGVPASDLEGEQAWPTQPLPVKPPPFARQSLTEANITNVSPESRANVLTRLRAARTGGQFIPPSTQGTVIFPGFDGGGEWGGSAFDPAAGVLYVNSNEMPWILTMVPIDRNRERHGRGLGRRAYQLHCAACHGADFKGDPQRTYPSLVDVGTRKTRAEIEQLLLTGRGIMPAFAGLTQEERGALVSHLFGDPERAPRAPDPRNAPERTVRYTHTGYNRFLDPDGYPAVEPPWGTLNAIDLNKGEIRWQVPLGEFAELTKRGVPKTGTENYGGPILTKSGILFIGATKDEMFRAIDSSNGAVLWETKLPAGGYATPATYSVNGKQFVVIAAGGGKMGTKSGDAYVAFALP